jgi:hypothetical protein
MKIYEIGFDYSVDYQRFFTENEDDVEQTLLDEQGVILPPGWKMPPVYIPEPKLAKPNFYCLDSVSGYFIVDQFALEYTQSLFERSGQLIDFEYKGEIFSLFKPIHCLDCLDHEKTIWRDKKTGILKHAFKKNRLDEIPVFVVPESPGSCFAIEGMMGDEEDELKYCIDHYGLKGLELKEEWSDE